MSGEQECTELLPGVPMKSCAVNIGLGEFVAQHQREYSVLGGFDCCTCGWTAHDGSGCATYEEHVEAAWLAARTA